MKPPVQCGLFLIGYAIIIGILILTKVVSSTVGAGLSTMGIIVIYVAFLPKFKKMHEEQKRQAEE